MKVRKTVLFEVKSWKRRLKIKNTGKNEHNRYPGTVSFGSEETLAKIYTTFTLVLLHVVLKVVILILR